MSKKRLLKVYSVYDKTTNSYPYYPQMFNSNISAYCNFLGFRDSTDNPSNYELHLIGSVQFDKNGSILGLQPNFYVYRIEFDENNMLVTVKLSFEKLASQVRKNLDHFFGSLFT